MVSKIDCVRSWVRIMPHSKLDENYVKSISGSISVPRLCSLIKRKRTENLGSQTGHTKKEFAYSNTGHN